MVSDIPAGDGKMANSFLQCKLTILYTGRSRHQRKGSANCSSTGNGFAERWVWDTGALCYKIGLTYCSSNGVDEVLLRVRRVVTALES